MTSINIDISRLTWFSDSPDVGDPACICSLCLEIIYDIPVRGFHEEMDQELRFHFDCFKKISDFVKAMNS